LLLVFATVACDGDVWALVRASDGTVPSDGTMPPDAAADQDAALTADTELDASGFWSGQLHGAGFHEYAGLDVHGRVGSISFERASSTIQPDGTFVLQFHNVIAVFESSIIYLHIDVTGDGICDVAEDYLGATSVAFFEFPQDFEVVLTPGDLGPNLYGCLHFR
jgi:hypothetical protein